MSPEGEIASFPVNLEAGDALLAVADGWAYLANAEDQLRRAPKFRKDEPWAYGSRERESELYSYYNVTPYWE